MSFGAALLSCVGLIIGGVGPWATWLNSVSISGTSMHGWREVVVGVVGLEMLGLHHFRGGRVPLIVAGVTGAFGLVLGIGALHQIASHGVVNIFGVQYQYLDPAWGLYLVMAAASGLVLCAALLLWRDLRAASGGFGPSQAGGV
jgi:hypothetical protein